nr:hypothetical protein CFP56_41303 [Quercus suber]
MTVASRGSSAQLDGLWARVINSDLNVVIGVLSRQQCLEAVIDIDQVTPWCVTVGICAGVVSLISSRTDGHKSHALAGSPGRRFVAQCVVSRIDLIQLTLSIAVALAIVFLWSGIRVEIEERLLGRSSNRVVVKSGRMSGIGGIGGQFLRTHAPGDAGQGMAGSQNRGSDRLAGMQLLVSHSWSAEAIELGEAQGCVQGCLQMFSSSRGRCCREYLSWMDWWVRQVGPIDRVKVDR